MKKYILLVALLGAQLYGQEMKLKYAAVKSHHPLIKSLCKINVSDLQDKNDPYFGLCLSMFVCEVLETFKAFNITIKNSDSIRLLVIDLINKKSREKIKERLASLPIDNVQ